MHALLHATAPELLYIPPPAHSSPQLPTTPKMPPSTHRSPSSSSRRHHHHPRPPTYPTTAPNCSICSAPAKNQCGCEFTSLVAAVDVSERKVLGGMWDDIRYAPAQLLAHLRSL